MVFKKTEGGGSALIDRNQGGDHEKGRSLLLFQ